MSRRIVARDAMLESPYARVRCHRLRTYTTQDDVEDAQLARLPIPRTLLSRSSAHPPGTISAGL